MLCYHSYGFMVASCSSRTTLINHVSVLLVQLQLAVRCSYRCSVANVHPTSQQTPHIEQSLTRGPDLKIFPCNAHENMPLQKKRVASQNPGVISLLF